MGEKIGLAVWTQDEAGPFQTVAYAGNNWQENGLPLRQPSEYIRNGTAKLLTLFHPKDGKLQAKGVRSCTNIILHEWLKKELSEIVESLPATTIMKLLRSKLRGIEREERQRRRSKLLGIASPSSD